MKHRLAVLLVLATSAFAGASVAPATAPLAVSAPQAYAKSCSSSYTRGVIGASVKCLRVGQFCARRYDRQYRRYGFRCTRYDTSVSRYRLTYAR